jgi:hypothetical protein
MASIDVMTDLLSSLPTAGASERGLLESVSLIHLQEHAAFGTADGSASRILLEEKRRKEEHGVVPTISFTPAPTNPLHDAIVAGHKANMIEILSRNPCGSRPKSKRGNKRDKRDIEKAESYGDKLTSKNGSRDKRSQRMNSFKKQY